MEIVFGFKFENDDTIRNIETAFKNKGIDARITQLNLKSSVEQHLFSHPDTDVIVIDEYLESTRPYSGEDLLRLVEMNEHVIVIPVIDESHKGDDYVIRLHNMGIFNGVYSNVDIDVIAELILNPRTRVNAKIYYGISSENSIAENERTNIPRLIGYLESMEDDETKIIDVIEYVRKRLSDTDFALFCERLQDKHIEIMWEHGMYTGFIGHRIDSKKKPPVLKVNIGNMSLGGRDKIVYKEIGNDITAVISPKRKSGCTFISINLAKAVADATGNVSGYLHLPDGGRTYTVLNLKKHIPVYKSSLQEIKDSLVMTPQANVLSRVSIICENPETDVLDDWDMTDTFRVMYQSPNSTILDLGFFEASDLKMLSECGKVVVVIDDSCSLDELVAFRNNILSVLPDNVKLYFVFNRFANENEQKVLREYVEGSGQCFILGQCREGKNHLYSGDSQFSQLAQLIGYDDGHKPNPVVSLAGKLKSAIKSMTEQKVMNVATVEVAVGAVNRGAGCTHTAMMIASVLARRYKVAFLDATGSGHIACLDELIPKEVIAGTIKGFPYAGVDFYHDVKYGEFASQIKDRYDFVVVDYGTEIEHEEYQRAGKRVVVMSVSDYRMKEIDDYAANVLGRIDKGGAISIVVPFKNNRELAMVRKLCHGNTVYAVPFCSNPCDVTEQPVKDFTGKIVGIRI